MENQHFLYVFRIHTYADLDIIFHQNKENENILHFMEILTFGVFEQVYFCLNKCRKAHSQRVFCFILRSKGATAF